MNASRLEPLMTAEDVAAYLRVKEHGLQARRVVGAPIGACRRFEPDTVQRFARGEIRGEPEGRVVEINRRAA